MARVANTSRLAHHLDGLHRTLFYDLALLILAIHQHFTQLFPYASPLRCHLFGEVLGHIAHGMHLLHPIHMHDIRATIGG